LSRISKENGTPSAHSNIILIKNSFSSGQATFAACFRTSEFNECCYMWASIFCATKQKQINENATIVMSVRDSAEQ
jgi:hypothetical protein